MSEHGTYDEVDFFPAAFQAENIGISGDLVVIFPPDCEEGWGYTPEDARKIGMAMIECAALAELQQNGVIKLGQDDGEAPKG